MANQNINTTEQSTNQKNIIITTGGTAGHVLPALCLLKNLQNNGQCKNINFIIDERGVNYINIKDIQKKNTQIKILNSAASNIFIRLLKIFYFFFKNFFMVKKIDIIVSFGTYNSVPILLAAVIWRKKIILHEQNCQLSRVNKIFATFANEIHLSFPLNHKNKYENKTFLTGMPLREIFYKIKKENNNSNNNISIDEKFKILIVFGSLDSVELKTWLIDLINKIPKKYRKSICFFANNKNLIKDNQIPNDIEVINFNKSFGEEIINIYNNCNLSMCRGGANFLYEMLFLNKKMIMVPLKNSVGNHQKINADYVKSLNMGEVITNLEDKNKALNYLLDEIKIFENKKKNGTKVNNINIKNMKKKDNKNIEFVPNNAIELMVKSIFNNP